MSIVDWSGAIKLTFDSIILTDVSALGPPQYVKFAGPFTPISTGDYDGNYTKFKAFDGLTSDPGWIPPGGVAPGGIGNDFGVATIIRRIRVYLFNSYPNAYSIQGSANNSSWDTLVSGNFSQSTGWKDIDIPEASYRYWRLYITSGTQYFRIFEMEFYEWKGLPVIAGWTVSAEELTMQPGGTLAAEVYAIKRVTKSVDQLEITLWLDMYDRMLAPDGLVTVAYNKAAGNLKGRGQVQVESFSITFTPTGLTPIINPNVHENLTALIQQIVTVSEVTYTDARSPHEYITATIDLDITVTKVGDLPL